MKTRYDKRNQLTYTLIFIAVLFAILFVLVNFIKTLEKFYIKPKGIIWSLEAFFTIIIVFSKLLNKRKVTE